MKKTRLSAKARADDEIWLYVAERDGLEAADRLIDRLVEIFPLLAAYPAMGKPREDVHPDARVFPVGSYLIFLSEAEQTRGDLPNRAWRTRHPPALNRKPIRAN